MYKKYNFIITQVITTGTLACPFFQNFRKKEEEFFFLEFVFLSTIYPSKENKGAFFHRFKPDEKIELLNFQGLRGEAILGKEE